MGTNLLPPGGGHHHQHMPADFLPIMTSMGLSSSSSEIFNSNLINTIPMGSTTSFMKPMNMMVGGMFSGSSGALFGAPNNNKSIINTTNPSGFLQEMSTFSGSSAQMSATALLQKAAQMGAAPTSSHTSTTSTPIIMQKSFVSMPAPAPADQGGGIFMSHLFESAGGNGNGNGNNNNDDLGMVMGGGDEDIMNDIISSRMSTTGGMNGPDVMMQTVDFLGIGGSRPSKNLLHEQQQQQQQRIQQLEEISQQRMQVIMDPFRHHDDQQMSSSHGDQPPAAGATKKPLLWDV